ncbi:MAG: ABC transporter substrate-binding protein [Clostridia bacterium]|nr:ABC transporter substrate-binding protein [Clostridia bacterium]
MKRLLSLFFALALVLCAISFVSCGSTDNSTTNDTTIATTTSNTEESSQNIINVSRDIKAKVYALKGPTGMGIAQLMESDENEKSLIDYDVTIVSSPTEITPEVIGGRFDIAAVPVNLASTLINKGADISIVAVNTLGVLYVIENGNSIKSINDLKGKKVYAAGKGSTPEYIFNYILEKNGLLNEVDVTYESDGSVVASMIGSGEADVILVPEPNVTSVLNGDKTGNVRIALDITGEWNKICDVPVVQGVIIASNSFIKNNPGCLDAFIAEYEASVKFAMENVDEASQLIEKFGIVPKAAVAKKALPNCNICCITGADAKLMISNMLEILFAANPQSVGGKLPESTSYYG